MLDLLEVLGRGFMALLRIAQILDFVGQVGMGVYWLLSPSYRRQVRVYEAAEKWTVYFGVCLTSIFVVVLVGYIVWVIF